MSIRNFYIECEIDGRKSKLTGGPRAKDGGFNLIVYQRSDGKKIVAVKIKGTTRDNDTLVLDTWTQAGFIPITFNQDRLLTER